MYINSDLKLIQMEYNKNTYFLFVVYLINSYYECNKGGAEYQAYLLARGWLQYGYTVHFVFLANQDNCAISSDKFVLHPIQKSFFSKIATFRLIYWNKIK